MKTNFMYFILSASISLSSHSVVARAAQTLQGNSQSAQFDLLSKQTLKINSAKSEQTLAALIDSTKEIFDNYQLKLDSNSQVLSKLQVGGTLANPVLKATIKKCISFICQTVKFDAEVSAAPTQVKDCTSSYKLTLDLSRSSSELSDIYDQIQVDICSKKTTAGSDLFLVANARHAAKYSGGFVKNEIMKFLQLQIPAILSAINKSFAAHQ